ncbi:hypothetical protein [Pontibaca salina]|uniref:Uncharacterized protein n=1 Tax=Pontibaca salina TaxID=2795731 RepID=A0A934HKX3_9RHOB|nr:hypothetical protein [Pontibaca salina]MBI6629988.1 hypothetical protein [Pontibaca salina]
MLWSDTKDSKALIWCEDHGDLAFYRRPKGGTGPTLDAGDWVQFELSMEQDLRRARNPRMMVEGAFSDLADRLLADASESARQSDPGSFAKAEIISFHDRCQKIGRAG